MAKDYRYGTGDRWSDERIEAVCSQKRSPKEKRVAVELAEVSKEIDKLIARQRALAAKVANGCTHPREDAVLGSVYWTDTLGSNGDGYSYITCRLCKNEIWRSKPGR